MILCTACSCWIWTDNCPTIAFIAERPGLNISSGTSLSHATLMTFFGLMFKVGKCTPRVLMDRASLSIDK